MVRLTLTQAMHRIEEIPGLPADRVVDFLALLGEPARGRVLEGSSSASFRAGTVPYHIGDPAVCAILEHGLFRVFSGAIDGRQATLGYLHPGELFGALLVMDATAPADAQAITDVRVLSLDLNRLRHLIETEAEVARAVATFLAGRLAHSLRIISIRTLGSIRDRVAFDLLDRCCETQLRTGEMVLTATHADLADAIGSSREVVSRTLSNLRRAGIVATSPGTVRVIDPERLVGIFRGIVR